MNPIDGNNRRWFEGHENLAASLDVPLTSIHLVYQEEVGYRIPVEMVHK